MGAAGRFIDGAGDFDLSSGLKESQPDRMLNFGAISGESPRHHPSLDPRPWPEELPTCIGEPELGWFDTHLKPGQWQCAQIVIEQPGAVGKRGILITDQPVKSGIVAGAGRFEQGINGRSDEA
jgi:hypothetical protein